MTDNAPRKKTDIETQQERKSLGILFSTAPFGDHAASAMAAYIEALRSTSTPWVCAACSDLQRDWSESRAPQPGDVVKRARLLMARARDQQSTAEFSQQVKQLAAPESPKLVKFNLADEMRKAAKRWDARTPEDQEAQREIWLDEDVRNGKVSEYSARRYRQGRT